MFAQDASRLTVSGGRVAQLGDVNAGDTSQQVVVRARVNLFDQSHLEFVNGEIIGGSDTASFGLSSTLPGINARDESSLRFRGGVVRGGDAGPDLFSRPESAVELDFNHQGAVEIHDGQFFGGAGSLNSIAGGRLGAAAIQARGRSSLLITGGEFIGGAGALSNDVGGAGLMASPSGTIDSGPPSTIEIQGGRFRNGTPDDGLFRELSPSLTADIRISSGVNLDLRGGDLTSIAISDSESSALASPSLDIFGLSFLWNGTQVDFGEETVFRPDFITGELVVEFEAQGFQTINITQSDDGAFTDEGSGLRFHLIPEPSGALLVVSGMMTLLSRRRNR